MPCTTLDALAAELPLAVGLLKIDVEGLERTVLAAQRSSCGAIARSCS